MSNKKAVPSSDLKRIDSHYIIHELQHILHFEKGILFTIKALFLHPGKSIRQFLNEDRSRLVKPVLFLVLTSLLYTSIIHLFHVEKAHQPTAVKEWVATHYGYANIIMGIFIGIWLKILFRKSGYNFFEILIMLCFVMGIGMLIFAIFALIQGLSGTNLANLSAIVSILYCVWAIAQFINGTKALDYLWACIAYVLGMETFSVLATAIGALIDVFHKG